MSVNNTMEGIITQFTGETSNFDLTFSVESLQYNLLGLTSGMSANNNVTISLNKDRIGTVPPIIWAQVFLHEGIHAELKRKVASVGGEVDNKNFPGIFDYYTRYNSNQSHELMAAHYLHTMVDGLKAFDNNSRSESVYEAIAWQGLQGTRAWDELSSDERNLIDAEISAVVNNTNTSCTE